jgi:hypothetical protein
MNERIFKLAREAALAEGWGPGVWQTTFTEKFAELIVKECIGIVKQRWINPDEDVIAEEIKQHFGVEL